MNAILVALVLVTADDGYTRDLAQSKADGSVLVVGVCCTPPAGDWLACRVPHFAWEGPMPRLVVSRGGNWVCDLPATATPEDIRKATACRCPNCACGKDCQCDGGACKCPACIAAQRAAPRFIYTPQPMVGGACSH